MAKRKSSPTSPANKNEPENNNSEHAEEVTRPGKKGRKASTAGEVAGKKVSPKKSRVKNTVEEIDEVSEEVSLFLAVSKRAAAVTVVVDEWIKRYEADSQSALAELVNFIIESAGWTGRVTREQLASDELDTLVGRVITADYITAGAADYPLISKKPGPQRKFKANFVEFWQKLVTKLPNRVLYPPAAADAAGSPSPSPLLETLSAYLGSFSNLTARPFRHTATVAGLAVISGLVRIASRVRHDADVAVRQQSAERRKGAQATGSSPARAKQQERAAASARLQRQWTSLEASMLDMFKAIFVLRYRDTVPDIRQECIRALGEWLRDYTGLFLQDEYLKYVGWSLNDRVAEVRAEAVQALERLFDRRELLPHLEQFYERFRQRLLAMSRDRDPVVQQQLVKLASALSRAQLLTEEAMAELVALTSDESAGVRLEAAQFVRDRVLLSDAAAAAGGGEAQVRALLQLVVEHTRAPTMPHYLVDALWGAPERPDALPALTDWAAMCDLLLSDQPLLEHTDTDDDSQHQQQQQQQAQCVLARMLVASVKKAAALPIVPKAKSDPEAPPASKDDRERLLREASAVVGGRLRALLERFAAQPEVLEELLELPAVLSAPTAAQLDAWLPMLRKALTSQAEPSVLAVAARSLHALASAERAVGREKAQAVGRQAADDIAQQLVRTLKPQPAASSRSAAPKGAAGGRGRRKSAGADDDAEQQQANDGGVDWAAVAVVLERAAALSGQFDCSDAVGSRVDDALRLVLSLPLVDPESSELQHQQHAVDVALRLLYRLLLWSVARLSSAASAADDADVATAVALRDELFTQLQARLDGSSETAVLVACDTCLLFARPPPSGSRPALRRLLGHAPSDELQTRLGSAFEAVMSAIDDISRTAVVSEADELDQRRLALVAALARPLVVGSVSERLAPMLLQHELQPSQAVRDLVRHALHRLRQRAGREEWRLVHITLRHFFERRPSAPAGDADEEALAAAAHHTQFNEIAARFSASYLPLQNPKAAREVRDELLASLGRLVQEGVMYALEAPGQFAFLDGLAKLLPKLPRDRSDAFRDFVQAELTKLGEEERKLADQPGGPVKSFLEVLRRLSTGERAAPPSAVAPGDKRKRRVARALELETETAEPAPEEQLKAAVGAVTTKKTKKRKENGSTETPAAASARGRKSLATPAAKKTQDATPLRRASSRAKSTPLNYAEPEDIDESSDETPEGEVETIKPSPQTVATPPRKVSRATLPQTGSGKKTTHNSPRQVPAKTNRKRKS
eukprot:TRINITY_DN353_c2_g1_i1.p1 TRINITY_DN353_c2_g1~~TRINITY_DN353_c2_g1_i1.p1  ORF type:complete len:1267 (+),score=423.60 TRINITY_DN353_c2_g1_i1:30-3830(+)